MEILLVFRVPLVDEGKKHTIVDDGIIYLEQKLVKIQLLNDLLCSQSQQEPPKERIKEFGSPGAVLFTGEYEKTRQKVREERTKDYHEFMKVPQDVTRIVVQCISLLDNAS